MSNKLGTLQPTSFFHVFFCWLAHVCIFCSKGFGTWLEFWWLLGFWFTKPSALTAEWTTSDQLATDSPGWLMSPQAIVALGVDAGDARSPFCP